ncbi:hypothetical protein [Yoonia sp. SS1-5]|uniref:Flp family type IVb pilin n=1 Tax=Yoonia rhodophyticola TaxID=3137370 RepID=A0AAN0M9Z9_9RHOB
MMSLFSSFLRDEDGAVTIDFVVLTAGITVLALAVGASIASGAVNLAEREGQSLADRPLGTDF